MGRVQCCRYQTTMETVRYSTLNRVKSFKRNLSLNLKPNQDQQGTTVNCNYEFEYVNFDTMSLADDCKTFRPDLTEEKVLPVVQTKRGVLWQISGKIFSSWQERFCVLTENSFYSFSKKSTSKTKTFKKVKLLDICDICLVTENGQKVLCLKINNMGKLEFKRESSDPAIMEEWYLQFLSNV